MEKKIIKYGNHVPDNDYDGYIYSFNTTDGQSFSSHLHACYEFIHIIHGQLIYTVEGSEYMLSDGDVIMTNPSELHSFSFPKGCAYQREFFHVYPGFLKNYPELTNGLNKRKMGYFNRFSRELAEKYELDKIFRRLEKYCTYTEPETDLLVLSLAIELFSKVNLILRKESPEQQFTITNKRANAVSDYIDLHYSENISLESIAAAQYISPPHLSRVFKKETGMTVKAYLNMRRITAAKNLIMEERRMIKNIYMDCGFEDYSTFYRAFVKYVGMSPEEFKKTHNQGRQ